ncbi:universal stress protein [Acidiferrimicrobium sp. IK]|uniref:universal stress protein n=1 Tax=Acidiferrimicrobium sp. IK TaxID=2871700 RepID=UPI0021CB904C|nr:universal stress protein [Acidiferrimicrobium sp. IK]MCU4185473.1 universal stress protein [Acidiferrimicrobium sp. IK]
MLKRILVGVDKSEGARTALAWAATVGQSTGAEVIVASTVADAEVASAGDPALGGLRRVVLEGDPRFALAQAGIDEDADLIVAGSSGISWYPAIHTDHVAHHLVCHADRAVAIVPQGSPPVPVSCAVLAIDGSPGSRAAVDWLAAEEASMTSKVIVLYSLAAALPDRVQPAPMLPLATEEDLHAWAQPLAQRGIEVSTLYTSDEPVSAICAAAGPLEGSTVVIGGRPVDDRHPLRLGQVGLRLLSKATRPVIVVPPVA